ncbi:MAG: hypothetical protein AAF721_30120 [Myxococcota bacterium]
MALQSGAVKRDDWVSAEHPINEFLPASYEFADAQTSLHHVHLLDAALPGTEVVGQTCHVVGETQVAATRRYPSGGTFTYVAFRLGSFPEVNLVNDFTRPFLQGYLAYVRAPAPE